MNAALRREVWLRGNVRPALGLAAIVAVAAGVALTGCAAAGFGVAAWMVGAVAVVAVAAAALLARAAAMPRLSRIGDHLEIRLAPG